MIDEDEDRVFRLLTPVVLVLILISACAIRYVPGEVAAIAVSWIMLSISVGIGFGHCVRNEP